jgi:hypothetical protein
MPPSVNARRASWRVRRCIRGHEFLLLCIFFLLGFSTASAVFFTITLYEGLHLWRTVGDTRLA